MDKFFIFLGIMHYSGMVLDTKDRKILYELENNCRQSYNAIAKKVGLSKTAVIYRIDRLRDAKVIDDFATITNGNKLGRSIYTVFLKLQGANKAKEKILEFIKSQQDTGWCVQVFGNWDIIFAALTKDVHHLQRLLDTIEQNFNAHIKDREVVFNTRSHAFQHHYLYGDISDKIIHDQYGSDHSEVALSKNDLLILNALKQKPRASTVEIADDVRRSPRTVKRSMQKLTESGTIVRFKAHINALEIGHQWNIALLSLKSMKKSKKAHFIEYIKQHRNFVFAVECTGKWNLILNIHSKNAAEFKKMFLDFRNTFDDVINHEEILSVAQKQKHFFNPVKVK